MNRCWSMTGPTSSSAKRGAIPTSCQRPRSPLRPISTWTIDNGVSANLATGIVDYIDTGFQRDRLFSIENIRTGNSTDRIIGSAGANVIESGGGYNVVRAGGGDDTIIGGVTRNSQSIDPTRTIMELLDGGAGNDVIDSGGSFWLNVWVHGSSTSPSRPIGSSAEAAMTA